MHNYVFIIFSVLVSARAYNGLPNEDCGDELDNISPFPQPPSSRYKRYAEHYIPSDYNKDEHPPSNDSSNTTQVNFSVFVWGINSINELNEEVSAVINLRVYWKDARLQHLASRKPSTGTTTLISNLLDKIWHPGIYIPYQKSVYESSLVSKTTSLRIYSDSTVRYATRITVTVACPMNFYYYPADTQRCNVDLRSYLYNNNILTLNWRDGQGARLTDSLSLSSFDVALNSTLALDEKNYGVRFTIILRRKLSYHLIQTYFPSTLFIAISWLSFLVPLDTVTLCMSILLTLTAMFSSIRLTTPNVSYAKALDIWMVACMIFVSMILAQYALLVKLRNKMPKPQMRSKTQTTLQKGLTPEADKLQNFQQTATKWAVSNRRNSVDDGPNLFTCRGYDSKPTQLLSATNPKLSLVHDSMKEKLSNQYEPAARKIEIATSALIPMSFVIFNFIYWPWLIKSAGH